MAENATETTKQTTDPTEPVEDPKPTEQQPTEPTEPITEAKYTDDDVNQIVKDKLARAKKEQEDAVAEAKKLAKMNADQKQEYELEKLKTENETLKSKQAHDDMKVEAANQFQEAGISTVPDGVLELAAQTTADNTSEAIKTLTDWFNGAKEAATTELLKGKIPKVTPGKNTMTYDEIMQMRDPMKRQEAIAQNPGLFTRN